MLEYLKIFKALSHKTRLRIVMMLEIETLCVVQITNLIGCSMATVSNHLKILKDAKMIKSRKKNQHIFYYIDCSEKEECGYCSLCKLLECIKPDAKTKKILQIVSQRHKDIPCTNQKKRRLDEYL